jgi:thioredoxin reductase
MTYDVVIIGAGAAGLNAALTLSRARRTVAIVDSGSPRNAPAEHMHGFLSRDGLAPNEFLKLGRAEVEGYGVEFIDCVVTRITPGFRLELKDGRELTARRIVVATGVTDHLPDIPGARERWGRDVAACPYCHGYEVRDEPLAVIGSAEHALMVRQWSADLIFFPHLTPIEDRARLTARDIRIVEGPVTRLVVEDDELKGVEVDGKCIARKAVFLRPAFTPNNTLLAQFGCEIGDNGLATVDSTGRTSVSGVWAVGNVVTPNAQVIMAAAAGATAAMAINMDLMTEPFSAAQERHVSELVLGGRRHGL